MTRFKWLLIGFVAGAMFGAASAKYDAAGQVTSRIDSLRGRCECGDAATGAGEPTSEPAGDPAAEAPAGATA